MEKKRNRLKKGDETVTEGKLKVINQTKRDTKYAKKVLEKDGKT